MSDSPAPQRGYPAGNPASPTIREIFALPEPGSPEQSEGWQEFQEKIAREVKGIKTASLPDLAAKIRELFDIPIPEIFLTAWTKAHVLQNFLAESQKDPETVLELELAEHTVNSQHRPHIEVSIQNTPVKRIEFTLRLIFKLKGFVLKIQSGAIREMRTGKCDARGTLEYQGLLIAEKMLAPISLPAVVSVPASMPSADSIASQGSIPSEVSTPSTGSIPSTASIPSEGSMPSTGFLPSTGTMPSKAFLPSEVSMPLEGSVPSTRSMSSGSIPAEGAAGSNDNEQRVTESTEQPMVSRARSAAR